MLRQGLHSLRADVLYGFRGEPHLPGLCVGLWYELSMRVNCCTSSTRCIGLLGELVMDVELHAGYWTVTRSSDSILSLLYKPLMALGRCTRGSCCVLGRYINFGRCISLLYKPLMVFGTLHKRFVLRIGLLHKVRTVY
jgi:hypothetical protein